MRAEQLKIGQLVTVWEFTKEEQDDYIVEGEVLAINAEDNEVQLRVKYNTVRGDKVGDVKWYGGRFFSYSVNADW